MAINEALFSVTGYVATQPKKGLTKSGTKTLTFRIGWTPREVSRQTGEWADLPSSFASVTCYRRIAENAACCLRKGDAIVLKGTLRVREYDDQAGTRRNSVDVVADFLGHDLARGTSNFSKQPRRAQQTADEYEQSQEASGDSRLPGDVAAERELDGQGLDGQGLDADRPEVMEPDEYGPADGAAGLPDDLDGAAHVALSDLDRIDIEEPDGDHPAAAGATDAAAATAAPAAPDALSEAGEPEATKSRGRVRKAELVGASS